MRKHRFSWLAGTLALGALALAPVAGATPITEFPPVPTPASGVCEVEYDSAHGSMWIEQYVASQIGRMNLSTGQTQEISLPQPGSVPGGMDLGPDGALWFPEEVGQTIDRLDPATNTIQRFPIPWARAVQLAGLRAGTPLSDDLSAGPDGQLYFASGGTNAIGQIDPNTHVMTEYPVPAAFLGPVESPQWIIKRGPGRTMVLSLPGEDKIVSFNVDTKQFTAYSVPTPAAVPEGVAGLGGAIWFTEAAAQKIGRIDPATGKIDEFSVAGLGAGIGTTGNFLGALLPGADGNLYTVVDLGSTPTGGAAIMRFNPTTHTFVEFTTPTPASSPCDFAEQPDAPAVYFGETTGNRVGRLPYGA